MPYQLTKARVFRATAGLCFSLALAGCPAEEESVDAEACEHLQLGPAVATASGETVDDDHRRYDLALNASANPSGTVSFASTADGHYFVFLNENVPLTVRLGTTDVAAEATQTGSSECTEIAVRHEYPLAVGTYQLVFGQTSETAVSIVIEPEHEAH
ncbi:MAG TPA: hypothetical protein VE618_10385 [Myxococcaceae bacterium]|nr:hypothetical protein [Myxococcaceae bacterium]